MLTPSAQPYPHQLYVRLTKKQRKEALVWEFDNRCILCGRSQAEKQSWSVANIITRCTTKDVSFREKAIICSSCAGRKHSLGIGEYANTLTPGERFRYIFRVVRLRLKGRVSAYKASLLLAEFVPFHLHFKDKLTTI